MGGWWGGVRTTDIKRGMKGGRHVGNERDFGDVMPCVLVEVCSGLSNAGGQHFLRNLHGVTYRKAEIFAGIVTRTSYPEINPGEVWIGCTGSWVAPVCTFYVCSPSRISVSTSLLSSALLKSVFLNESLHLCCMHNHPCHFPCCLGTLRHLLTHYVITVVLSAMNVYGGNVFAHKNESCCELSRGSRVRMPLPVP